ncbi:acylphosphatase [Aquimarina celericrescens]|uniref:acylphosphatase n=1 Tax=Aquimarina celericrescens TaxID=1964542 RepID=A0ABW5AYZ7_9FLAO|nr:acylphosphatase [Aquimarina celericrescens]
MLKHYNITVKGKVQGVWYRKSTQDKARELGITGFVKNLSNSDVYIEAEGSQNQLQSLIKWCAIGPEFANVDDVIFEESQVKAYQDFEILH